MSKRTAGAIFADILKAKASGDSQEEIEKLQEEYGKMTVEQLSCGPSTEVTVQVGGRTYSNKKEN